MADDEMEEASPTEVAAAAAQAAGARFGGSADEMAEASPASPAERVAAAHLLFLAGLANPADENASSSADERSSIGRTDVRWKHRVQISTVMFQRGNVQPRPNASSLCSPCGM